MKCSALISKVNKHGKAQSERPNSPYLPKLLKKLNVTELPVCGGDIKFSVDLIGGGPCHCDEYCYCSGPEVQVTATCSNCQYPYFEGIDQLTAGDAKYELERLLNSLL